ncbi:S41 family peptidase [Micavibrio aeruginosavorus]|uniref:S41 family peptidase n=1 Tax=Micavibrio aeruginosavorus TaxID=349221 RepID=UPI003F4AB678
MQFNSKTLRSAFLAAALGTGVFGCATVKDASASRPETATVTAPAAKPAPAPTVATDGETAPKIITESPDIGPDSEPVIMVPMTLSEMETVNLYMTIRDVAGKISVHDVDQDKLSTGAIDGMLKTLSPHDSYVSPEDLEIIMGNAPTTIGIGVVISMEEGADSIRILELVEGGGAHKAGLKPEDHIIAVGGVTITKDNLYKVQDTIGGPAGTTVAIRVRRDDQELDFTITRAPFTVASVASKMIGTVSYIQLRDFLTDGSPGKIKAAITKAASKNPAGYILDLRSNTGGRLEQATDIVDMFVDGTNPTLTIRGRGGAVAQTFNATPGDILNGKKLVVLINDGSASASEIVAGALKDFGRATIIGTQSFGKGSVQSVLPLAAKFPDRKDAIKVTVALYHLPSGDSIQGLGVMPDIFVQDVDDVAPEHERDLKNTLHNPEKETRTAQPKFTCAVNDGITPDKVVMDARITTKAVDKALLCALEHVLATPSQTTTKPVPPAPQPGA